LAASREGAISLSFVLDVAGARTGHRREWGIDALDALIALPSLVIGNSRGTLGALVLRGLR
jgi:hypothetical protein